MSHQKESDFDKLNKECVLYLRKLKNKITDEMLSSRFYNMRIEELEGEIREACNYIDKRFISTIPEVDEGEDYQTSSIAKNSNLHHEGNDYFETALTEKEKALL